MQPHMETKIIVGSLMKIVRYNGDYEQFDNTIMCIIHPHMVKDFTNRLDMIRAWVMHQVIDLDDAIANWCNQNTPDWSIQMSEVDNRSYHLVLRFRQCEQSAAFRLTWYT